MADSENDSAPDEHRPESSTTPPAGETLPIATPVDSPSAKTTVSTPEATPMRPTTPPSAGFQFSLTSLLLWTTLLAVIFAVSAVAPGVGIGLAILSFPAALRTIVTVNRYKARTGTSADVWEKSVQFLAALGVAAVVAFAGVIAFTTVCFPIGLLAVGSARPSDLVVVGIVLGVVLGLAAGISAVVYLGRLFWK